MPSFSPIIRPLGPIVQAFTGLRNSLYSPPRTTIQGVSENLWPNPLQPVQPMAPVGAEPLGWQMNWGRNLIFTPREDAQYSAAQLRRLGKYVIARICIENNKDILTRMPHKIQAKGKPGETSKERVKRSKGDEVLLQLNKFFERPDGENFWSDWLRPILDDMLVIDAASIFVGRQKGTGLPIEYRWVEGGSITRLVDEHGWTPKPPSPAYQQLWEGYPRLDLTTDQLIYRPRNIVPRNTQSSYLYGYSPTEQISEEIEIGIARLQFIRDFYEQGSIPGGMLFAPRNTPPDKIKEAQGFLDSDLAGQLAKRRRLQILQGFQEEGKTEQVVFPKEPALTDIFDELHIRKICFAYGTSPQRLMRMMNRASAQVTQESSEEEGTLPWLNWLKGIMDYIIQVQMKKPDYEFTFDPFMELDVLKQSMSDAEDIKVGLYTRNEKRVDRGDEPREEPEADELNIVTGQGVVPLSFTPPPRGANNASATEGSRAPSGGHQPRAAASLSSSQSVQGSGSTKTNGHTRWEGCSLHKDSFPRISCSECVRTEIDYTLRKMKEAEEGASR